jgi:hypothetical protein
MSLQRVAFRVALSGHSGVFMLSHRSSSTMKMSPFSTVSYSDFEPASFRPSFLKRSPTFLFTEKDLAKSLPIKYHGFPIRKFSLSGLGLNQPEFLSLVRPYYKTMEWDYYDVRRSQLELIQDHLKGEREEKEAAPLLISYYKGDLSFQALLHSLPVSLPSSLLNQLSTIAPFRKKTATCFRCYFNNNGSAFSSDAFSTVRVEHKAFEPIAQAVTNDDIRSVPRVYPELSSSLRNSPLFGTFLQRLSLLVKEVDPSVAQMDIVLWQTSLTPTVKQASSNSPEGIHQDGADFIVSALIVERENVDGAESVIYQDDKQSVIASTVLEEGEGIFQADSVSPLWHTVTPITIKDPSHSVHGIRNSLGFDFFNIVRRSN